MSAFRRNRLFFLIVLAAFASVSAMQAQITLNSINPAQAPPSITPVTLIGSGFPSTATTLNTTVTITPPPGTVAAVTVTPLAVAPASPPNNGPNNKQVIFYVPPMATSVPIAGCQITVTVTVNGVISSSTAKSFTVQPPATVTSVSPGAGQLSTAVSVKIAGSSSHFNGTSVITAGAGITVSGVVLVDATHINATFNIGPAAAAGVRVVTVKTGSEVASLATGFLVAVNPSLNISLTPVSGAQGQNMVVHLTGVNTNFIQGTTLASFGDGVKVNSVTVNSSTTADASISIDPIATLGARTLTVTTSGEYAVSTNGFTVTANAAQLLSVAPSAAPQGGSTTVTLTGVGTHWVTAGTTVSFGGGIVIGTVTVTPPTSLTVNITVPNSTPVGFYAVTATTLGETVTLPAAFQVTLATPFLSNVSPTSGTQGQTNLNVVITGQLTSFNTGLAPTINWGPNITQNSIVANSATQITANITIANTAFAGGRTVTLTSNATNYSFNFSVIAAPATSLTGVTPNSGLQGASMALTVTGNNTHWVQGLTAASLDPTYITINRVVVNTPATTAEVDITIAGNAPLGARSLTMSTGGEIVTLSNAFTVLPFTPTLSIAPSSGMIATTQPVIFNGSFTHFIDATTTANISGQGVLITAFKVLTPFTAQANLQISGTAPTSPGVPCLPGNRTITLTTVAGAIDEIVTAPFCVTSTPAVLTSISPGHSAVPATSLLVSIAGQFTHFTSAGPNATAVGFGPNIVAGSPNIIDATHLTVAINIAANAALGYRQVFVNTGTEQLTIGFHLDYPATSTLTSVFPNSGAQGQTLTGVVITGNLTNWAALNTQLILGQGITIGNLVVNGLNTMTADISISPTTPVGGRSVTAITGGGTEVESGSLFSVTPGIASVSAVGINTDCTALVEACPAPASTVAQIQQGDTKSFRVVGVATHFVVGDVTTTLDFGPGISVTQVHVVDATHLNGQITVAFSAATGFRSFRVITDGEIAPSFSNAVNVLPVTGTINITPTSAPQGTNVDITVNGVGVTHFDATHTTATFGNNNGVMDVNTLASTITSIAVTSPTQMVLHARVLGTAGVGPRDVTVTTTNVTGAPANIEQITLPLAFSVSQGAASITVVTPTSGLQGQSANLQVTGQNTNFLTGVTTAFMSTGGCNPASPAGVNVSNVTASDTTHATVAIAVDVTAQTGIRTLCMFTGGESASYANAFQIMPGIPTLNGVSPVSGLQGESGGVLNHVNVIGQFTHWVTGTTTITFGQGITTNNLVVDDATHAHVDVAIDALAQPGSRPVVVTTGSEVVQGGLFLVLRGPAILSTITPSSGNQGQQNILMTVNGQFTHWAQGLTQFSIGGGDITVNGFLIQNATTAVANLSLSPTAYLGTRTVTMSTAGEVVSLQDGFLVTGGIPSIISISPGTFKQGDSNVNVQIAGVFTHWTSAATHVFMGTNINLISLTRNSDTALTAVISVPLGAATGVQNITVQTGGSGGEVLAGQVNIISNALPSPYISYEAPSVALKGQTLSVYLYGQYTTWLPSGPGATVATVATFGAGILVNNFQVTGLNSAVANITIDPTAGPGTRTVTLTTGAEVETTSFTVTVGTPVISLIDPPTAIQGQTRTVNLVGQYTTWQAGTPPTFNFGAGVAVVPGTTTIFGPTAARVDITVDILAPVGGRSVSATNGAEVSFGFVSITASTATITSVTPNTVMQGTNGFITTLVGFHTHWLSGPTFSFGGGDVGVTSVHITSDTQAEVTLNLAPLAAPGLRTVHATTAGEDAYLVNAFVVQPGTPVLLSSTGSGIQQNTFHVSVLGQFTNFDITTRVDLGNGAIVSPGAGLNDNTKGTNITGPQSVDVTGSIDPLAFVGCRDVTVTTGAQVMKLFSAFCIGQGPAAITLLAPNTANQGQTVNVAITGTNTHFIQGITAGSFGPGISLNTLTVPAGDLTHATANITIAANAIAQQNSITLTTQGEVATDPLSFLIGNSTPVVSFINGTSGTQGTPTDITVTGSFTHWQMGQTTATFGAGITATVTAVAADATHATVHLVISPTAPTGNHAVSLTTNLAGGAQEIAVYTIGAGAGTPGFFTVNPSAASVVSAVPSTPATVRQNDNGDLIVITGLGTHFDATSTVNMGPGVNVVASVLNTVTQQLTVTVNVDTFAATGTHNVTVTTGGEVATGNNLFTVNAGLPVLTSVNAISAHQGDTLDVSVLGQYTHFTAASTADFGATGITVNGPPTLVSSGSATFNITIDPAAALTARAVTVNSPGPEAASKLNAFTVLAGVPQVTSVSPTTGAQGLTQNIHITGLFTHFTTASVVTISGIGVTVGNPPVANPPGGLDLFVNFLVTVGAPAGLRNVTVTTGAEVVTYVNAFNVLPGSPNLSSLTPNIGVPNSSVTVSLTGVFTHFQVGNTTANFGPGISVNGAALGADGLLTVNPDGVHATANLVIDSAAGLGARNVAISTPAAAEGFTVVNGFTVQTIPTTPVPTYISPAMGLPGTISASNVPINTNVTVVFNEPMLGSSITAANAFITDVTAQGGCWGVSGIPANVSLDVSGRILTIQPTGLLAVGRDFYLQLNSYSVPGGTPAIKDASGTQDLGHYCQRFSTGFAQDASGPTFVTANIPNAGTGIPTNAQVTLGFDKPINPASMSGSLSIVQGAAAAVPGTWTYTTDFTQAIFTPAGSFPALATFTVTYTAGLTDSVGHPLTNPGTLTFTTAAGPDDTAAQVTGITPVYNSTVGTNPVLRFKTDKPLSPLSVVPSQMYVYNQISGAYTYGTVTHSADFKTFDLQLTAALDASTQYRFNSYSMIDWAGHAIGGFNEYFYTSAGPDVTSPAVISVSPPAGSTAIAVNSTIWVHFSKALNPVSVAANAITLTPAVAGTVAFNGTDYATLIFTPTPASLAISTPYTIHVAGLQDQSGNPMTPFVAPSPSFTTSGSPTPDTTNGAITSITPTGTNVPVNTNVVIQLSKPVNPASVNASSVYVFDNNNAGHSIPGTVAISANLMTLTFTATSNLPSNHQICAYASYYASLYDLTGLTINYNTACFTTSNTPDVTAPTVISVTPLDSSTGIGPNNPVVVTFSKAINPGTLSSNVAMYTGSDLYTSSFSLSADSTTISLNSGTLPYNTTFTVVVSTNIADLAGNHLAAEKRTTFTTAPQPVVTRPQVNTTRPGPGATSVPMTSSVTFFTSAPMNPATVTPSTLHISENGVLLNGPIALSAGNQAIKFTPAGGFQAGALIQVWFTSGAQDSSGNALFDYGTSFTIAPDLTATPLTISSRNPCYGCQTDYTTVVDVLFTKPVNPATVTPSSFFVNEGFSPGSPVNGTISFLDNNRLIRFTPNAPGFAPGNYFTVYLTGNIQDTNGLAFAGSATNYNYYAYAFTTVDNAPPSVSGVAPTNGATGIGINALVSVTFSENADPLTLDPAQVILTGPGGNIPLSISYNSGNFTMTVTPQSPLDPSATVTLTLNGVSDGSGNALSPTPYTTSFTTAATPDYNPPSVVQTSYVTGQTNVPVTSNFKITFNKPIDLRSVVPNNTVYLRDATLGYPNVPASLSWSAGNTVLTITPNNFLNVGHQYNILVTGLADLNGNVSSTLSNQNFFTVLVAPAGGPVITQFVPPNGSTGVAENFKPVIQFDRPIQAGVLAGVALVKTAGSVPVPMTPQLSNGNTTLTLVPNSILLPGTGYTVTVAGVKDVAGNTMAGSVSRAFTTGGSIDLVIPQITLITPIYNSTVGTNPQIKVTFNEPINPLSVTNFVMYQLAINRYVNGVNLVWAADFKSVQMTYPGTLDPSDHYFFYLSTYCDLAGNCGNMGAQYFYTAGAPDISLLTVTSVNPPNTLNGVPVNPAISLRLSKPAAPTSVNNSSVSLSGVPGTTVSLSADGLTLALGLPANLTANTGYSITVPAGAFTDANGNAVAPFSSTFTTSATGLSDANHGGVSLTNPAPGSTGVALTTTVTVTFSKPFNPTSLIDNSFILCKNTDCNQRIAGSVSIVDANHLLFTPAVALPPGTAIGVFVYPFTSYVTDLAGNNFDSPYLYDATFTTASTIDNTPPSVQTMTPGAGASNVGPLASVSLTFNKSLDPTTVNATNFALYAGPNNLGAGVSVSADRRSVYLSTTLPFAATITVAVTTNVKDYAGNSMAAAYQANFTTEAQPLNFNPTVIQTRPGNGAPLNGKITVFTNSQINLTSAQNGVFVAQNGALIGGAVALTADLHGIVWTPSAPYLAGATIEVFVTSTVTDLNLNAINPTNFTFTTQAAACVSPTTTAYQPGRYDTNLLTTNPVIEIQFCKALNPATVNSTSFHVTSGSNPGSGVLIPGTISVLNGDSMIRFVPTSDLPLSNYLAVQLTNAIQDTLGNAYAGDGYYLYVQPPAVHDATPPAVSSVTPVDTATNIGDNAPVRIVFNKRIDTLTAGAGTVMLNAGAIPYTATFSTTSNSTQTVMTLTPLAPLTDSSTITVHLTTGVKDLTGVSIPDKVTSFHTGAGADFQGPYIIQQSIDNANDTSVPVNTTFTLVFNKPLDPSTVVGNPSGGNTCCFFYSDSSAPGGQSYPPSAVNLSPDGRTVTIIPTSPLTPSNTSMRYYWQGATDLNGNAMTTGSQFFTTAAGSDLTAPTVVQSNPVNTAGNVPTNAVIEVIFNKAVRGTSLGSITLDGTPVAAVLNNGVYTNDTVVKLVPSALLLPGHTYSLAVSGVQDVAGNTLSGTYSFQFTTGPNFKLGDPNFVSAAVAIVGPATTPLPQNTNVINVLQVNPVFTLTWDSAMDFASLPNAVTLRDESNNLVAVPVTYAFTGPDQRTVNMTVNGTLTASTVYHLWIYYSSRPVDISGNYDNSQRQFPFTTQSGGSACPAGQTNCAGVCRNLLNDSASCGACGQACAAGQTCNAGACAVACPAGQTNCGGVCTNVFADGSNCGACGHACAAGQTCSAGTCAVSCAAGQTNCGGVCTNLLADSSNCGACGNTCGAGLTCNAGTCSVACVAGQTSCSGVCTNLLADPSSCGACGNTCTAGHACAAGACSAACLPGLANCSGAPGACNVNLLIDASNCGACGHTCTAGHACLAGTCQ